MSRPSFIDAKYQYPHRYTMEHMPYWAKKRSDNGKFYAPQYRTDLEWYENTIFPGEVGCLFDDACYSKNHSWPIGLWLDEPFNGA